VRSDERTFLLVGDQTQDSESGPSRTVFERIWKDYGRKENKQKAWKEWQKLKPTAAIVAAIEAALDWQRKLPQWQERKQVHFSTYLTNRRWEDERPTDSPFSPLTMQNIAAVQQGLDVISRAKGWKP
jgi:hypothetical protein